MIFVEYEADNAKIVVMFLNKKLYDSINLKKTNNVENVTIKTVRSQITFNVPKGNNVVVIKNDLTWVMYNANEMMNFIFEKIRQGDSSILDKFFALERGKTKGVNPNIATKVTKQNEHQ